MWACLTYRLVPEQDVHVGHDLHEAVLEELGDEGSGEVQAEHLVVLGCVLGHLQDGLQGDRQEETLRRNHGKLMGRFTRAEDILLSCRIYYFFFIANPSTGLMRP